VKAIIITTPGGPDVLQLQEREQPEINNNEVLIQVKAAGVNRPDVMQRKGNYPAPPGASTEIPGLEVAGIIKEVGVDEKRFTPGDEVCALVTGGGYSEFVAVPGGQCLPIPIGLTFEEAASLPETFFTVWTNIFDRAQFREGDVVLVHGGSSGIGVAAIQMITVKGGKLYTTARTKEKCDFCEQLGAEKAINYKEEDFEKAIKRKEPEGIDIILDMVGGDYTAKNINLLRPEGRLVIINAMKERIAEIDLMKVMVKRLVVTGSTLRARDSDFKHAIAANLEVKIWPYLESGEIKPIIYKTFPLGNASEAHSLMENSDHIGKIILTVS